MTLDHVDSENNIVSAGHLIVGKANDLKAAQIILDDTMHSFVDLNYKISNNEKVEYKRKKVSTNNFVAVRSNKSNSKSLKEAIKNIEIIENF